MVLPILKIYKGILEAVELPCKRELLNFVFLVREWVIHECLLSRTCKYNIKPLNVHHQPWLWLLGLLGGLCVMTGPLKVAKFSQDSVQSSLERVRISWNMAKASRQCCLCSLSFTPLPRVQVAYGTLRLSSIFRRSWVRIPAGSRLFFCGFTSRTLTKNIIIHECLLSLTVNSIKPLSSWILCGNNLAYQLKLLLITHSSLQLNHRQGAIK